MAQPNKRPPAAGKAPAKRPMTKEEAIRQLAEQDPQRAAAILREILGKKP